MYKYAQCQRGRIHFAEAGLGEPLLLMHATPLSHRSFRNMLPLLAPNCRAMYNVIFDFDFNAALAQLDAPTLVLELLTPDEAHHSEQAAKVCSLMKRARAARVENGDRSSLEKNPLAIVTPILDFLRSQR